MRHSWGSPDRRPHETIRVCTRCGLTKVTHHEWDGKWPIHWSDYWDVDRRIHAIILPPCVPVREPAHA